MKLIIDIPDHIYELAKENKLKYWTQGITDNIVFKALANGAPFDFVIENIKTEIESIREDVLHSTSDYSPNEVLDILDDILCRL